MHINCQMDTNQQLPWLKEIKKTHGSVEVTSLMQADAINYDGIYTVGKRACMKPETTSKVVKDKLFKILMLSCYTNVFVYLSNNCF